MKRIKRFTSIRMRMMITFTILISIVGLGTTCLFTLVFRFGYSSIAQIYLKDVNRQTSNNLENNIQKIEDINIQMLSSQIIQNQLRKINGGNLDSYELLQCKQTIERELSVDALYASYVVSLSVISREGMESSAKKIETGGTQFYFTEEEIYKANGTSLWGLVGEKNRICVAKAILDLDTMKPIGYINLVYENSYFSDIVADNSTQYSGASYIVDETGRIIGTNREQYLGNFFPEKLDRIRTSNRSGYDVLSSSQSYYYVGHQMQNGWTLVQTVSVKEFNKDMNRLICFVFLFLFLVLFISFVLTWYFTSKIARPVQELKESMKDLGKDGKYPKVQIVSNDEIGMIGVEYNKMAENIENLIEKVYKMELTQKQAELEFLQMQINPHFLYNALDTISWMALGQGNMEVSEMTIALAELLRATIKNERFISLREEMSTVRDYLYIQSERFGDKIEVEYAVEESAYVCTVPNFILQPIIENAIIHGLEPKIGKGKLMLTIQLLDGRVLFTVEDNGVGMTPEEIASLYQECRENTTKQSIGLKNVYRRLLLCYGEESLLQIESKQNQGTKISFSIPLQEGIKSEKLGE